jgi:hypothetical protein
MFTLEGQCFRLLSFDFGLPLILLGVVNNEVDGVASISNRTWTPSLVSNSQSAFVKKRAIHDKLHVRAQPRPPPGTKPGNFTSEGQVRIFPSVT